MLSKFLLCILLFVGVVYPGYGQKVVINEVMATPDGGTNTNSLVDDGEIDFPENDEEWVELYNRSSCDTVDLSCYILAGDMTTTDAFGNENPNWGMFKFPDGTKIPPNGFLVIGGRAAPNTDIDLLDQYNNTSNLCIDNGTPRWFLRDLYGWIALYEPGGAPVDAVYWNTSDDPNALDSEEQYDNSPTSDCTCNGQMSLKKAKNIADIEFAGEANSGSDLSFIRDPDGTDNWVDQHSDPTPGGCNTNCVQLSLSFTKSDPVCGNDGEVSVSVDNNYGLGPFTYEWSPGGQTTKTISNLSSGTYVVTVTDRYGCTVTDSATISGNPPTMSVDASDDTCDQNVGSIVVNASGGDGNYEYSIDDGANFQPGNTFTGLASGTYIVVLKDGNGCEVRDTVDLLNVPGPTIDNIATADISCNGGCDGSIDISASGGTGALQYSVDGGNTFQGSNTFTGLCPGSYDVVVKDEAGCEATGQADLSQPPPLSADLTPTDATCNGKCDGTVDISASGGTPPYEFSKDNGNTFQADSLFTGLCAGTFDMVVRDANGCEFSDQVTVEEPPALDLSLNSSDAKCKDSCNGQVEASTSGGTKPYRFSIDTGTTFQSDSLFKDLCAGAYQVIVADTNDCRDTATVSVGEPPAVSFTTDTTQPDCGANNGQIVVNASGGNGNYQYSNDNGNTFQGGNTFNGLPEGSYIIVVEDGNGCRAQDTVELKEKGGPDIDAVATTDISCNGACDGTIDITASGGTSPLEYSVDGGNNFKAGNTFSGLCADTLDIVVRDANDCETLDQVVLTQPGPLTLTDSIDHLDCYQDSSGSIVLSASGGTTPYQYSIDGGNSFQGNASFKDLGAGVYDLVVEDANGCRATFPDTVKQPPELTREFSAFNAGCHGVCDGSAVTIPDGGTEPYTFLWSDDLADTTSAQAKKVCAGAYDLTIRDANGCTVDTSFTVEEPPPMDLSVDTIVNASCANRNDGRAAVNASGGNDPYTYQWGSNAGSQTGKTADSLAAGTYQCMVEDKNGCSDSIAVTIAEPPPVTVAAEPDTTICIGGKAQLSVAASGGFQPYTYEWSNGLGNGIDQAVGPDSTTTYTVIAEDSNGCRSAPDSVTVDTYPPLQVTAFEDSSICPGDSAPIMANGSGGNGAHSYTWNNGMKGDSNLVAPASTTTYTVTLDDGCETPAAKDSVTITIDPLPKVAFTGENLTGCAPLTVRFGNDTDPDLREECTWELGDGTTISGCDSLEHTYEEPGCYDVTLTVNTPAGCVNDSTYTEYVCVYPNPVADFAFEPQPTTVQDPEIHFTNTSTDASEYRWTFGDGLGTSTARDTSFTFPADGEGVYDVCLDVRTDKGCKDTICKEVKIDGEFIIYVPNAFSPNGDGDNDEFYPVIQGYDEREFDFYVFDRWGDVIFESHHPDDRWDGRVNGGKMAKSDTYVWKIVTRDKFTGEKKEFVGHVTLLK